MCNLMDNWRFHTNVANCDRWPSYEAPVTCNLMENCRFHTNVANNDRWPCYRRGQLHTFLCITRPAPHSCVLNSVTAGNEREWRRFRTNIWRCETNGNTTEWGTSLDPSRNLEIHLIQMEQLPDLRRAGNKKCANILVWSTQGISRWRR
jgi:uncharacterized protein (DUF927 family)